MENDNWEQVNESSDWDLDKLQEAVDYAKQKSSYSLILIHKGKILSENYWQGYDKNSKHLIASSAKSITGFLMGILQTEYNVNLEDKVGKYIGVGWSNAPIEKENLITIRHLLTMTSGLDDELNYVAEAGKLWYYNNSAYYTLFKLYEPVSGMTREAFTEKHLFSKTGMNNSAWATTTMQCTARDMARFGLLILSKGVWQGDSLIKNNTYFNSMINTSQDLHQSYGYLWWLNGKPSYSMNGNIRQGPLFPSMPLDGFLAMGKFDQRIHVIPSLNLVVVRQGEDTVTDEFKSESFDDQLWQRLRLAMK